MKRALATLVLAIPAVGYARSIDDAALQTTSDEFVNSCDAVHGRGFCNEICGCMTGEMGRHWDEDDFRGRIERLQADAAGPGRARRDGSPGAVLRGPDPNSRARTEGPGAGVETPFRPAPQGR